MRIRQSGHAKLRGGNCQCRRANEMAATVVDFFRHAFSIPQAANAITPRRTGPHVIRKRERAGYIRLVFSHFSPQGSFRPVSKMKASLASARWARPSWMLPEESAPR
jgi:hypothetical protein